MILPHIETDENAPYSSSSSSSSGIKDTTTTRMSTTLTHSHTNDDHFCLLALKGRSSHGILGLSYSVMYVENVQYILYCIISQRGVTEFSQTQPKLSKK
jgi:hypothetical protein